MPWHAANRDEPQSPLIDTHLYTSLEELDDHYRAHVQQADLVVVGSYVPDGTAVIEWALKHARGVVGFYDIDTPITLEALKAGTCEYLTPSLIPRLDMYLSFTGGPTLKSIEDEYSVQWARALYCSVDPQSYHPIEASQRWTWATWGLTVMTVNRRCKVAFGTGIEPPDRQFVVAGPQYPQNIVWPGNVQRFEHLAPQAHTIVLLRATFYVNVTRQAMIKCGHSPSIRLFEAASCAAAIISDNWPGLETVLEPGSELMIADSTQQVLQILTSYRRKNVAESV